MPITRSFFFAQKEACRSGYLVNPIAVEDAKAGKLSADTAFSDGTLAFSAFQPRNTRSFGFAKVDA